MKARWASIILQHQYFTTGFWLLFAQTATSTVGIVGTVFFAHQLTATDFGIYRYLISISVLVGGFALTGSGQAILHAVAKQDLWFYHIAHRDTALFNILTACAALAGALYYALNENFVLASGCTLIAFLQPSSLYFINALAFMHGGKEFRKATLVQVVRSVGITGASITTLFLTHNINMLFGVYLSTQAITGYLSWIYTKGAAPHQTESTTKSEYYRGIAKHVSIRNLLISLASRLDSIIVFQQLGSVNLAIFTIATLLPEYAKGTLKHIPTILVPRFISSDEYTEPNLIKRTFQGFLVLLGTSLGIALIIPHIYSLLFPTYPEAVVYAQLLILSLPASAYHIKLSWLQAHTKEHTLYTVHIVASVIQILLTILGTFAFGLIGAIGARILAQYAHLAITLLVRE